jgi:four helix bundle protein
MRDHRPLPAFQHVHELVLAVHEAVGKIPGGEASALAARMESAAHSAAAAIARACAVPGEQFGGQLDEASRRLREVGYYIDIAQRMGYLPLGPAVELLELQTLAGVEVNALFQGGGGTHIPGGGGPETTAELAAEVLATLSVSSR